MKLGIEYIFVIIAFIAVITMASYDSAVVAYQKDDLFPRYSTYEGMDFSEINGNVSAMNNPQQSYNSNSLGLTDASKDKSKDASKENFEGKLSPSIVNIQERPLDTLSQIQGSKTCDFNSALGYSNSMGPLCIDDNAMKLLRTRGGNQSGVPSQIG